MALEKRGNKGVVHLFKDTFRCVRYVFKVVIVVSVKDFLVRVAVVLLVFVVVLILVRTFLTVVVVGCRVGDVFVLIVVRFVGGCTLFGWSADRLRSLLLILESRAAFDGVSEDPDFDGLFSKFLFDRRMYSQKVGISWRMCWIILYSVLCGLRMICMTFWNFAVGFKIPADFHGFHCWNPLGFGPFWCALASALITKSNLCRIC